ncbi:nucleotidyltransferase domain-containing protein [Candidatus Woesearchaeota archaeon]|nr:nucleotidyltransferase domain-containing protein [Candidatus Woesearchaeota archaeon]
MKQISYNIIEQLLKKESFPREIARELKTNPMSVIRCLHHLTNDNIVSFRQVGKSKVYSLKKTQEAFAYACIAEHNKRLKLFKKYPALAVLAEDILRSTSSGLIIIFGSYAKFNAKKDSDIDLYVETSDGKEKEKLEQIYSGLSVKTGLFDTESILMREIVKNHVILRGVEAYFGKIKVFDEAKA